MSRAVATTRDDYAGAVSRGLAFGVDVGITTVAWTVGYVFVRAASAVVGVIDTSAGLESELWSYVAGQPVAFVAYCTWFWALVGRTPGMMLLGLRVVRGDGAAPSGLRAFVRASCFLVSAVIVIGVVWMLFDSRRQALHDKIAGTFVVYDEDAGDVALRSRA